MKIWIILVLLSVAIVTCNGYKILFITTVSGKSHWLFLQHIIRELIDRQHELTVITPFLWPGTKPVNYTEVLIDPPFNIESILPQSKVFEAEESTGMADLLMTPFIGYALAEHALNDPNIRKFIHRTDLHFDLVINEEFFQDSISMFAHKFKAPQITISTYGFSDFFDRQNGLLTPWSIVPHVTSTYSDAMTFSQRWYNAFYSTCDWLVRRFVHLPWQTKLAEKHFGHLGPLPSLDDINKNVSLILVNSHRSVLPPRPMMPGTVLIGGAHIKPPKPLPIDIKSFLDKAEHGAIYFSFGTYVRSSEMPKNKLTMILDVFKRIKQRVLWKYDDDKLENIPSNVMVRKWLPQNDILAHPNVVLFISHGGMFGFLESLYNGVPLIMIPFFGDQHRNAVRAQNAGHAKFIKFNDITEEALFGLIHEMTTDPSYKQTSRETSAIFKKNLMHPLDEAVWWIEYVCEFRGAKHLKSNAIHMSWFSYLLIDVLLATVISISFGLILIYLVLKMCCRKFTANSDKKKQKIN